MLGIVAGSARVRLGGEDGAIVEVRAGDVVVIPAGVAHKSEGASPDLLVVGAYPGGHGPDMCVPGAGERERALGQYRRGSAARFRSGAREIGAAARALERRRPALTRYRQLPV